MKVLIGLGNPGKQYEGTRHNAGRMLVDYLYNSSFSHLTWKSQKGIEILKSPEVILVKSKDFFMNESGKIVQAIDMNKGELWVAHDDLDIRLGEYKIQQAKGPEVHGGVNDIERVVGKDFWRIRIGVDNRGVPRIPGEEYVLQRFSEEEMDKLQSVIDEIAQTINRGEESGEDNG